MSSAISEWVCPATWHAIRRGHYLSREWQKLAHGRAYLREAQVAVLTSRPRRWTPVRARVFERFAELTPAKMAMLFRTFSTVRMGQNFCVARRQKSLKGPHDELMPERRAYPNV